MFGFRKKLSTQEALVYITESVRMKLILKNLLVQVY